MSWKNHAFARMVHGIYEVLLRTHQAPEQTPSQSAFSAFLRCPHNCIFEDSAGHNGPASFYKHTYTFPPVPLVILTANMFEQFVRSFSFYYTKCGISLEHGVPEITDNSTPPLRSTPWSGGTLRHLLRIHPPHPPSPSVSYFKNHPTHTQPPP